MVVNNKYFIIGKLGFLDFVLCIMNYVIFLNIRYLEIILRN